MNLTLDVGKRKVTGDAESLSESIIASLKLSRTARLLLTLQRDGATMELGAGDEVLLVLKPEGEFEGDPLQIATVTASDLTLGKYDKTFSIQTEPVRALLGLDGNAANDVGHKRISAALVYIPSGGEPEEADEFFITLRNAVYQDEDAEVDSIDGPEAALTARAVRHDIVQSISTDGKGRARTNIGASSTVELVAVQEVADSAQADIESHLGNTSNPHGVTKAQVGLVNVDNTSDANKPVSTATSTALAGKADLVGGFVPTAQIPAIAITEFLGSVASEAAMLALAGQKGDWCVRSDLGTTFIITGASPAVLGDWTALSYPAAPVLSVAGHTGTVTLSKGDVGLGNVDNTTDAGKPVSTATQTALDGKVDEVVGKGLSEEDYSTSEKSKLAGIEASADVTDAANVDAAGAVMNGDTSTAGMGFVIDEDSFASDLATKVPTQQSVKAFVQASVVAPAWGGISGSLPSQTDLWEIIKRQPIVITSGVMTMLTSGAPADIGTITVPAWLAALGYRMPPLLSSNIGVNFTGTAAAGTCALRTASGGGGSVIHSSTLPGPASDQHLGLGSAQFPNSSSVQGVYNATTLHVRQTANSANASDVRWYITLFPVAS